MSKNALALVDCSNREKLFHFLINTFDRKSTKKEMISPYDDQLIGKMNFRYSGVEHAMFFTYARSSEYPGMKFRNHKIIYLSLDVNDISSDIFNRICTRFGGYVIYNDDLEIGWEKVDRQQPDNDDDLSLSAEIVAERHFLFDTDEEGQERKVYREIKLEPDQEEEAEEREWAPPVVEAKEPKPEKKSGNSRNSRNHRVNRQEPAEPKEKQEKTEKTEKIEKAEKPKAAEQKSVPKITVSETLRSHERQKEQREARELKKTMLKNEPKAEQKADNKTANKDMNKDNGKETHKPNHRRGHRGGRKHNNKAVNKEHAQHGSEKQTGSAPKVQ